MSIEPMAKYTLSIEADSGYCSTTEGRCTADQYGDAIAALHGTEPKREPLTDEQSEALIEDLAEWSRHVEVDTAHESLEKHVRRVLAAHGIKGEA